MSLGRIAAVAALMLAIDCCRNDSQVAGKQSPRTVSGPSLESTMKFIQDKLNEVGEVEYTETWKDSLSKNRERTNKIELSSVIADPAHCTIEFIRKTDKIGNDNLLGGEPDGHETVLVEMLKDLHVMSMTKFLNAHQHSHQVLSTDPADITVVAYASFNTPLWRSMYFIFPESTSANRVGKALSHAFELCGGKIDPF